MIEWSSSYETGISSIDKDHKNLFAQVIKLGKTIQGGKHPEEIEAIIHSLILYVDEHFEREERFMRRAGFPDYEDHKQKHDAFRDTINSLADFHRDHADQLDGQKIVRFLQDWLLNHITKSDMDYRPYLSGEKQGTKALDQDMQQVPLVTLHCDPEIHDKVQHFIKLISENTEEGELIDAAVEKITQNQIRRRQEKARSLFGK